MLEATILFPEGGGQPSGAALLLSPQRAAPQAARVADFGTLNGRPVVYVRRNGDSVIHTVRATEADFPIGADVDVQLDWQRRFDHMQQHTAQHLTSAVALGKFGWVRTRETAGRHSAAC